MLEEDVAYSSIAQDEIGHARALYELLAHPLAPGATPTRSPTTGPSAGFRQARLLDLDRGDWAASIARRYLYDTADAVRLAALSRSAPMRRWRGLLGKIRREERVPSPALRRLARAAGRRGRRAAGPADGGAGASWAPTPGRVLSPLPDDLALVMAGVLDALARRARRALAGDASRRGSSAWGCRCRHPPDDPADGAIRARRAVPLAARRVHRRSAASSPGRRGDRGRARAGRTPRRGRARRGRGDRRPARGRRPRDPRRSRWWTSG